MKKNKSLTVIGMMTGTSFDGIDAAIIRTNGEKIDELGLTKAINYSEEFRKKIRLLLGKKVDLELFLDVNNKLAVRHAELVNQLLKKANLKNNEIDLIGFHGQTIYHNSGAGHTLQIGNAALLSELTGISVVSDFRTKDIATGGQGAPLVPLFHKAICESLGKPIAILNIGGVSNITYLGSNNEIIAFDTGPGGALLDDWMYHNVGKSFDDEGNFAKQGLPYKELLKHFMENKYFEKKPPKSMDRNAFKNVVEKLHNLNAKDAAATLTYFIAESIYSASKFLPQPPTKWLVCGGGRKNKFLLSILKKEYGLNILLMDTVLLDGHVADGDFMEAQAFGFLATRSYYHLPITLSTTTGSTRAVSGGAFYRF
jgi:anhydro-N-acetylmuramic acid kinase